MNPDRYFSVYSLIFLFHCIFVSDAFNESMSKFGKIDIVCNNAGIARVVSSDWRKVTDVNVVSF